MKRLWLAILMQLVAHDVGQLPEEHDTEDSTRRRKQ